MKHVIYGLMAFFLPLFIVIGVYRHTPLDYDVDTHHYTDSYRSSEMVNYFIDSYSLDTERFKSSISDMSGMFDSDNWDYKSYVSYEFINLAESNTPLSDFFKNFVQFFRMVGNFFVNVGNYFKNVGLIFYNSYRIVFNIGWIVFTLQFKLLKLAGYVVGFGG